VLASVGIVCRSRVRVNWPEGFYEHFHGASPHKTHEEAWFLMAGGWMHYLEAGDTLRLLPGIPRAHLSSGQCERVASFFGPVTFHAAASAQGRRITARVECATDRIERFSGVAEVELELAIEP
jgi:hypothetical protein